jgi:hypothetical protein
MNMNARRIYLKLMIILFSIILLHCKRDEDSQPPAIRLIFDAGFTENGDTLETGRPIRFKVEAEGTDVNITNFTVKKLFNGITKTVLDSGMNSNGFSQVFTFFQSIEERVEWKLSVLDRNRNEASVSIVVYKDPDSQFGGIYEFSNIRMGYQLNNSYGHFFLPVMNRVFFEDSASMFQDQVDILVYFNYREDLGVLKPSPTFSSPGEESSASGELYDEYYPSLLDWTIRNYTKYDIRAVNGITPELFENAHNDSLLIVSYDDVWGKKKYKWANSGTFIPIQTASGKKGIIRVDQADHTETGTITFSLKLQM